MNFQTFNYNNESWVGEAISKAMRGHQPAKCFNCGKFGHLKGDCRQGILGITVHLGMAGIGNLGLQVYVGVVKEDIERMNADQQQTDRATGYHRETP